MLEKLGYKTDDPVARPIVEKINDCICIMTLLSQFPKEAYAGAVTEKKNQFKEILNKMPDTPLIKDVIIKGDIFTHAIGMQIVPLIEVLMECHDYFKDDYVLSYKLIKQILDAKLYLSAETLFRCAPLSLFTVEKGQRSPLEDLILNLADQAMGYNPQMRAPYADLIKIMLARKDLGVSAGAVILSISHGISDEIILTISSKLSADEIMQAVQCQCEEPGWHPSIVTSPFQCALEQKRWDVLGIFAKKLLQKQSDQLTLFKDAIHAHITDSPLEKGLAKEVLQILGIQLPKTIDQVDNPAALTASNNEHSSHITPDTAHPDNTLEKPDTADLEPAPLRIFVRPPLEPQKPIECGAAQRIIDLLWDKRNGKNLEEFENKLQEESEKFSGWFLSKLDMYNPARIFTNILLAAVLYNMPPVIITKLLDWGSVVALPAYAGKNILSPLEAAFLTDQKETLKLFMATHSMSYNARGHDKKLIIECGKALGKHELLKNLGLIEYADKAELPDIKLPNIVKFKSVMLSESKLAAHGIQHMKNGRFHEAIECLYCATFAVKDFTREIAYLTFTYFAINYNASAISLLNDKKGGDFEALRESLYILSLLKVARSYMESESSENNVDALNIYNAILCDNDASEFLRIYDIEINNPFVGKTLEKVKTHLFQFGFSKEAVNGYIEAALIKKIEVLRKINAQDCDAMIDSSLKTLKTALKLSDEYINKCLQSDSIKINEHCMTLMMGMVSRLYALLGGPFMLIRPPIPPQNSLTEASSPSSSDGASVPPARTPKELPKGIKLQGVSKDGSFFHAVEDQLYKIPEYNGAAPISPEDYIEYMAKDGEASIMQALASKFKINIVIIPSNSICVPTIIPGVEGHKPSPEMPAIFLYYDADSVHYTSVVGIDITQPKVCEMFACLQQKLLPIPLYLQYREEIENAPGPKLEVGQAPKSLTPSDSPKGIAQRFLEPPPPYTIKKIQSMLLLLIKVFDMKLIIGIKSTNTKPICSAEELALHIATASAKSPLSSTVTTLLPIVVQDQPGGSTHWILGTVQGTSVKMADSDPGSITKKLAEYMEGVTFMNVPQQTGNNCGQEMLANLILFLTGTRPTEKGGLIVADLLNDILHKTIEFPASGHLLIESSAHEVKSLSGSFPVHHMPSAFTNYQTETSDGTLVSFYGATVDHAELTLAQAMPQLLQWIKGASFEQIAAEEGWLFKPIEGFDSKKLGHIKRCLSTLMHTDKHPDREEYFKLLQQVMDSPEVDIYHKLDNLAKAALPVLHHANIALQAGNLVLNTYKTINDPTWGNIRKVEIGTLHLLSSLSYGLSKVEVSMLSGLAMASSVYDAYATHGFCWQAHKEAAFSIGYAVAIPKILSGISAGVGLAASAMLGPVAGAAIASLSAVAITGTMVAVEAYLLCSNWNSINEKSPIELVKANSGPELNVQTSFADGDWLSNHVQEMQTLVGKVGSDL